MTLYPAIAGPGMLLGSCRPFQNVSIMVARFPYIAVLIRLFVVAQTKEMMSPIVIAGSDIDQCPQQEHRNAVIEEISNIVLCVLCK